VPAAIVVCAALDQTFTAFDTVPFRAPLEDLPRPFGPLPGWLQVIGLAVFVLNLALVLASALSLVGRYRRADAVARAQITWLALAGLVVPVYPLLCGVEILIWGEPAWVSAAVGVAGLAGIPVATAIAMLRHDLYDVDEVFTATVTYGLVSAILIGVYAAGVFVGGLLFGRTTPIAAVAATALCAVILSPVRARLQRGVDRRLYPVRRAALDAVEALKAGDGRPEELQDRLRVAVRDPGLRVGYRVPGTDGPVDTAGADVAGPGTTVTLSGRPIGVLTSDVARPELLRQIAGPAATLVEVVRLRLEVAWALREVESSRARLVQIGYEERRRLERDLHDGAQQRLVSLGMAFRLAQRHLDEVDVDGLLDQAVAELGTALAELRTLAYGLRPGRLDDGLDAALTELVRAVPIAIDLDVCADRLPDDIAATAYYVASEALTNAVKHASPGRIGLRVARDDGSLLVRISDDGCGGATVSTRSAIADRVAALGGTLRIVSPVGSGTVVEAVLPCAS
jgi:signal transduction histidine kinase